MQTVTQSRNSSEAKPLITPAFVLDVVRRWWKVASPSAVVLATLAGGLVYLFYPPKYEAKTLFRIKHDQPYLVHQSEDNEQTFIDNQLGLIRSPMVMAPVMSRPEIAKLPELQRKGEPYDLLTRQLNVSKAFGNEYFYLKAMASTSENAALLANAVWDSYFTLVDTFESGRANELVDLLGREQRNSQREVESLREQVRSLMIAQTGHDPRKVFDEKSKAPTLLADLWGRRNEVRLELTIAKFDLQNLEKKLADATISVNDETIQSIIEKDPEIQRLNAEVAKLESEIRENEGKGTPQSAATRNRSLKEKLETIKEELVKLAVKIRETAEPKLIEEVKMRREEAIQEKQQLVAQYQLSEEAIKSFYDEELEKLQRTTGDDFNLQIKRLELERAEKLLNSISDRIFGIKTEMKRPVRISEEKRAAPPIYPVEFLPIKQLLVAIAAGLCLPFALALLWDLRLRRITSPDQLEDHKIRVLAEITTIPTSRARRHGRSSSELRLFEETIENLRTCLAFSKSLRDFQVLVITSSVSGEGKTTIAAQLATSIAKATNEPTLLIDADMRSPDIHHLFEIKNKGGLAQYLEHSGVLKDIVVPSFDERLHLLPAGRLKRSPHRLIANGKINSLIDEARKTYRHIIIDTPPTLAASESLVFAAAADATIVCTMRDISRYEQVQKTCEKLSECGANVVGCVFNGISASQYKYYYGEYNYGELTQ